MKNLGKRQKCLRLLSTSRKHKTAWLTIAMKTEPGWGCEKTGRFFITSHETSRWKWERTETKSLCNSWTTSRESTFLNHLQSLSTNPHSAIANITTQVSAILLQNGNISYLSQFTSWAIVVDVNDVYVAATNHGARNCELWYEHAHRKIL